MRACPVCDRPLPFDAPKHRIYCGLDADGNPSDACKQVAYRRRRRARNVTMLDVLAEMREELRALRSDVQKIQHAPASSGPRQMTLPGLSPVATPPAQDDAELEIKQSTAKTNSAQNLIDALNGLQRKHA